MEFNREERIAAWALSLALAGVFLSLKGSSVWTTAGLLTLMEGALVGGLIGLGFGLTFAKPTSRLDRWLKPAYAALPFGIIGALVGYASAVAPEHIEPGFQPTIVGALWGVLTGVIVGLLAVFESYRSINRHGSSY